MILFNKIVLRFYWFLKIGYKFILTKTNIKGSRSSVIIIDESVTIRNSNIDILPNSSLKICAGTIIENVNLSVNGNVVIGQKNFINNGFTGNNLAIRVTGYFELGSHNRIQSSILLRHNGRLTIGDYNNINFGSEIRVDERISIGSYNQMSYKVVIWDTNTHNIYKADYRRRLAEEKFPVFGYEFEKPSTKPVIIGNDCWIGREVAMLKGVELEDKCIIGFRAFLTNKKIQKNTTVVNETKPRLLKNEI